MAQRISISINPLQKQKQMQHLMMSPQMQQALNLLQLPLLELSAIVEMELQQNPILELIEEVGEERYEEPLERELEFHEQDYERLQNLEEEYREHFSLSEGAFTQRSGDEESLKQFLENSIVKQDTIFESLMIQVNQTFDSKEDKECAELIVGHLDEKGFLTTSLKEIADHYRKSIKNLNKILKKIQEFEPYGIGAENLQESLLIQLRCLGKAGSLAYAIVDKHYNDLINNRIPLIAKSLKCGHQEIVDAVQQHVASLDFRPGAQLADSPVHYIKPDVSLRIEGNNIHVDVESDILPPIRINRNYLKMLSCDEVPLEEKNFIKNQLLSAKWLLRNLQHRNSLIERIAGSLVKRQRDFFLTDKGKLIPLKMKTIAEELEVHESTIARAVANKYLDTPYGLMPFRSFFTHAYTTEEGENVSSSTVQGLIKEMIEKEDKGKPISDAAISGSLSRQGIVCARRTVAKYRAELNLGNAKQRKRHTN